MASASVFGMSYRSSNGCRTFRDHDTTGRANRRPPSIRRSGGPKRAWRRRSAPDVPRTWCWWRGIADAVGLPKAVAPLAGGEVAEVNPSAVVLDSRHAHAPWLLELPDPITKTDWDNFATLAAATARALEAEDRDELEISVDDGEALRLPVLVQPGQHPSTVALGWGCRGTERFANVGPLTCCPPSVPPRGRYLDRRARERRPRRVVFQGGVAESGLLPPSPLWCRRPGAEVPLKTNTVHLVSRVWYPPPQQEGGTPWHEQRQAYPRAPG